MATLGKAVIEFSADTAKFVGDIGRTASIFEKNMARMEAGVTAFKGALAAVVGAGGVGMLIRSTMNGAEELGKLSQKIGVSVEQLSELKYAAELADVGMDDLTRGFKEFNKALVEATDPKSKSAGIFSALGVSPSGDPAADLRKVADAFAQLQDGATKSTIAGELFGKSGLAWIPLLNQGGGALDKAADQARKLGLVIGPELARQSEQFNDNLKTLSKGAEALGINITKHVVGGLATFTDRMVQGAEKGEKFKTFLRESLFFATALAEQLNLMPRFMGQAIFDTFEPGKGVSKNGPFRGVIKGPDGKPIGDGTAPVPNADALACAATGGRWINGKCVRPGGAKIKDDNLVGRQWAEQAEEDAKIMSEAAAATADMNRRLDERNKLEEKWSDQDFTGMTTEQIKEWEKLKFQGIDTLMGIQQSQMLVTNGFDEMGNAIKKVEDATTDWGFTFNSQLEDVILGINKGSNALKAFGQDLARMVLRKGITEPLSKGVNTLMAPVSKGIGEWFSGLFKAEGGPVSGGNPYIVGEQGPELFVPRGSGMIVPNDALAGAGATNINVTVQVQALDPRTAAQVILANVPVIAGAFRTAAKQRGQRSAV